MNRIAFALTLLIATSTVAVFWMLLQRMFDQVPL